MVTRTSKRKRSSVGTESDIEDSSSKRHQAEEVEEVAGTSLHCDFCRMDIVNTIHIRCAECREPGISACLQCFASGRELVIPADTNKSHIKTHKYRVIVSIRISHSTNYTLRRITSLNQY
jgi:hypothetical protein